MPRAYTAKYICEQLSMSRSTFFKLKAEGKLPFLEELEPRCGRSVRYRAELVDRYLNGEWGRRSFRKAG